MERRGVMVIRKFVLKEEYKLKLIPCINSLIAMQQKMLIHSGDHTSRTYSRK